jgi:hypothetical protein
MVIVGFILLLEATLTTQSENVVPKREMDVLKVHARQVGLNNDPVLVLIDVHGRIPVSGERRAQPFQGYY